LWQHAAGSAAPPQIAGGGMKVETFYSQGVGMTPQGGVQIIMDYIRDAQYQNYYAAGSDEGPISTLTDANGNYSNPNKRTPAVWSFVWGQNSAQPQCWAAFDNDYQILVPPAA
jgi:hypothetical protein